MAIDFDHFLLTRFSAVLHPGAPPPDEDWLYYRLGFFVDACLPSVLSQQGAQPFEWLVLLDDRCSYDLRNQVEELAAGAFTPLWTHEPFRRDSFAAEVARRSRAPHLITTRIDSDDAMAVDFMASVQAQFAGQERLFVNFPRGIQIDRSGAVYRSDIVSSPFLSLVERRRSDGSPPETVYVAKHARARGHAPLRQVRAQVMWAQVLHGTNLSNIVNGVRVHPRVVADRFRFDLRYAEHLTSAALLRGRVHQLGQLGRLWAAHPGELTKWLEAQAVTARGTRTWPQDSGDSLTDRVPEWERSTRARLRQARWDARARANSLLAGGDRHVSADVTEVLARERVVVLAEWSRGSDLREDAARAAQAWASAGFGVMVVAARDPWVRLRAAAAPAGVAVVRRPNTAYDFGSWAHALRTWPALAKKDLVVLTNDSLVGPLGSLNELVRRIEGSSADVWAATANQVPVQHLQSYLLAFRGGVLSRAPLREFFADVQQVGSKRDVVLTYEVGLTRVVDEAGLLREAGWTHSALGLPEETDLPLMAWRTLLDAGFPFVKRALVASPQFASQRAAVEHAMAGRLPHSS